MNRFRTALRVARFLVLLALLTPAGSVVAQSDDEPILEQARALFSSPGMTFRFLARVRIDPGIDGATERVSVDQGRMRVEGTLDGGFSYLVQSNFAAAGSTLLDTRVGWSTDPAFYVWAGRFKAPYSQEFIDYIRDVDFAVRARGVTALSPNRQVGVQVGGQLTDIVSWAVGGFTGPSNTTPGEPLLGVVRLRGTEIELGDGMLAVSGQAAFGRDGAIARSVVLPGFDGDGALFGVDARFESGPLLLAGELHRADWTPAFGADLDAYGGFLTAGWMVAEDRQILARWDQYRAPGATEADDVLVFGFNAWPTSVTRLQANWQVPLRDSGELHRLSLIFQVGN